jgi:hypothetical protein
LIKKNLIYLIAIATAAFLATYCLGQIPDDDAYITFRYAQNIAEGNGFVYNIGEHIQGTTTPLFTLLLSLARLLGFDIPASSVFLSALFLFILGIFAFLLTKEEEGNLVGIFTSTFVILNPWILQCIGNEMALHLCLHMALFYFLCNQKYSIAWIFAALATLNRGDGIIITILLFTVQIIRTKKLPYREISIYSLVLLPWLGFSFFYFGSFFPSTLSAKVAQGESGLFASYSAYTIQYLLIPIKEHPILVLFHLFSVIGLISVIVKKSDLRFVLIWVILFFIGYEILGVSFALRYFIPLTFCNFFFIPMGIAVFSSFVKEASEKIFKAKYYEYYEAVLISIISTTLLFFSIGMTIDYKTQISSKGRFDIYKDTGLWLRDNTISSDTIGLIEIGIIGYYSDRKIIDYCGLITPGTTENMRTRNFSSSFNKFKPDYFVYNSEFSPWLDDIFDTEWFSNSYKKVQNIHNPNFFWTPIRIYEKVDKPAFNLYTEIDQQQLLHDSNCRDIYGSISIGQSFTCQKDNLCAAEILIGTFKKEIKCDLEFELNNINDKPRVVRQINIVDASLKDNSWFRFSFDPIENSRNSKFVFIVKAPGLTEKEAFTIWKISDDNEYRNGSLYLNDKQQLGDLCFRTRCKVGY